MSMKMLTALQLLEISGLYAVLTLLLPAILLYRKISSMRFSVRFMIYQTVGNFYIITLVLILQLLHISNWFTLSGVTALSFLAVYIRLYKNNPKQDLQKFLEDVKKLSEGTYGLRLYTRRIAVRIMRSAKRLLAAVCKRFIKNLPDVLLMLAVFAAYMMTYGVNAFEQYGYCTSDIVVHNYWINYMGRGKPFVAGVYPLGFHSVIYYLHEVFFIDTYVLLRLFWAVQTFVIHLMLLAFIRICSKTKYTAYVGLGVYLIVHLFRDNTYSRYISSLPQEFGMIFILPAVAFLFLFFEYKNKECLNSKNRQTKQDGLPDEVHEREKENEALFILDQSSRDGSLYVKKVLLENEAVLGNEILSENKILSEKEYSADSYWYLLLFVLNFSLTLSIHFYNTIIAGIFCVGIAGGYCFRLFRRQYFGRVMLAGIAAIMIAVLPMLIAYLGGTPLEGSLYWGMNIINGTAKQSAPVQEEEDDKEDENLLQSQGSENTFSLKEVRNIYIIKKDKIILNGEIVSRNASIDNSDNGGRVVSKGDVTIGNHKIKDGQMLSDARLLDNGEVFYEGTFLAVGYHLPEEDVTDEYASSQNKIRKLTMIDRVREKIARVISATFSTIKVHLIYAEYEWICKMVPIAVILLGILSVLFFILRQTDYAARMMSVTVYMALMTFVFVAPELGLPELMDASGRTCIYYAYSLIALWCLCIDGIVQLTIGKVWQGRAANVVSFLMVPALITVVVSTGTVKKMYYTKVLEPNDAVVCLTNIIRDHQDETWTIVSANDELRMGEDHGYHYEIDTFLRKMEHKGAGGVISIPTKKVFFFIEKIPIDYTEPYEDSGQKISRKGAAQQLPDKVGIEMYKGRHRWVEMSRMYFWAEQFHNMYPNEMDVYYETEDFICYCVDQNEYSLFNFSIDYRYNMMKYEKE